MCVCVYTLTRTHTDIRKLSGMSMYHLPNRLAEEVISNQCVERDGGQRHTRVLTHVNTY